MEKRILKEPHYVEELVEIIRSRPGDEALIDRLYFFRLHSVVFGADNRGGYRAPSCQKATALAAATFSESTPCDMGMRTV